MPIETTPAWWWGGRSRDALGWLASLVVHAIACFVLTVATFGEPPGYFVPPLVAEPVALEQAEESLLVDDLSTLLMEDSEPLASADVPLPTDFPAEAPMLALESPRELPVEVLMTPITGDLSGMSQGIDGPLR